jgi:DNA-binding Lrp family transcriptional regulator
MIRKKELVLLSCLRNNSRETLTNISKKTKIPISTIFDKLKEYEKSFIKKHTTLIDFKKLGYDLKIYLMLKVNREKRMEFQDFVLNSHCINNVCRINNGYDYFVEGIFKDINSFQVFLDKLEGYGVNNIMEHFVIDEIKKESFLSDKNYVDLFL